MTDITEIVQHIDCNLTAVIQQISVTLIDGVGHKHNNYTIINAIIESPEDTADNAITAHLVSHAPDNAQKNSDILKSEIEAKLTGELSSHTHVPEGGASFTYTERIVGELYTGPLGSFVIPDELDGKYTKEVRLRANALPAGQSIKIQVFINGLATTDSIFTGDVPIELGTGQSETNGVYQVGCDTSGSTVGTSGTSIDGTTPKDLLAADDVITIYVVQVGNTYVGADLKVEVVMG
jgi:hypothetical protein